MRRRGAPDMKFLGVPSQCNVEIGAIAHFLEGEGREDCDNWELQPDGRLWANCWDSVPAGKVLYGWVKCNHCAKQLSFENP